MSRTKLVIGLFLASMFVIGSCATEDDCEDDGKLKDGSYNADGKGGIGEACRDGSGSSS